MHIVLALFLGSFTFKSEHKLNQVAINGDCAKKNLFNFGTALRVMDVTQFKIPSEISHKMSSKQFSRIRIKQVNNVAMGKYNLHFFYVEREFQELA